MSWDNYSLHMYGVNIYDLELTDKIKALCNMDGGDEYVPSCSTLDELYNCYNNGDDDMGAISEELFDKIHDFGLDINYGPGASLYAGFDAIMPYDMEHVHSKEELDKRIYDFLAYFCGEEVAKAKTPYEIYVAWAE